MTDKTIKNVVYITPVPKPTVSKAVIDHLENLLRQAKKGELVAIATAAVDHRSHLLHGYAGKAAEFRTGLGHGLTGLVYELDGLP